MKGTSLNIPERVDVPLNANDQFAIELYSK